MLSSRRHSHLRTAIRWIWRIQCLLLLGALFVFAYGTPEEDAATVWRFVEASRRWTTDPEFRQIQMEYVRLGSAATQARAAGITAGQFMMGMRRVPYLPPSLAANEGSQHHYDEFAAGELRAYFRLSAEQGTDWVLDEMARLTSSGRPSDEQLRQFLLGFQTDEPLRVDEGAIRSARSLFEDVGANIPRDGDVLARLREMAAKLSISRGMPAEINQLTVAQQEHLFGELDDFVRQESPELWRVKQVNDFLNGIWAHTFGQTYARWCAPLLNLWRIARVVAPLWLALWIVLIFRRICRSRMETAGPDVQGQ